MIARPPDRAAKRQQWQDTAVAIEEIFGLGQDEIEQRTWVHEPLPFWQFMKEHQGIELWPKQREDLERLFGSTTEATKRLFTQNPHNPYNCAVLAYGKGCLAPWERLTDHSSHQTLTVEQWANSGRQLLVRSWNRYLPEPRHNWSSPVYRKGRAMLYQVTLESDRTFYATDDHQCYTPNGWVRVGDIQPGVTQLLTLKSLQSVATSYEVVTKCDNFQEDWYYDLTVERDHNYFDAQGILHHNSGKDLMSASALSWFVHVLLCLDNPQKFLELEQSEPIDLAIASPTLRQTRRITFTKFKSRLKGWQWLLDRLAELDVKDPVRYLEKATEAADFVELPHKIRIHNLPLDSASAEGFNLLAFILSEYAGLESDAKGDGATKVFETFVSSGRTRFQRAWKGFLASYPRSLGDPQEKLIEAHEQGQFPELFVVRRPTWEVHPGRKFEDFKSDFDRNPEDSWAKYGAQPRAAVDNFFRSPDLIVKNALGGDERLFRKHFPNADDGQINWLLNRMPDPIIERDSVGDAVLNKFGFPQLAPWVRGRPGISYFGHIDVGLSRDSCGFAIAHLDQSEEDGPVFPVLDLGFRWKASHFTSFGEIQRYNWHGTGFYQEVVEAAEIDLKTVNDFAIWLKKARGFDFELFTVDGYNSAQLRQTLFQMDIPCQLHIVDKSDYDELKGCIYQRQLKYRCDRILFHELAKLELRNGKVDAPRTKTGEGKIADSHKDLADCAAAVVARLARLATHSVELGQLPEVEDIWDRIDQKGPVKLSPDEEVLNEQQRRIMQEFFDS